MARAPTTTCTTFKFYSSNEPDLIEKACETVSKPVDVAAPRRRYTGRCGMGCTGPDRRLFAGRGLRDPRGHMGAANGRRQDRHPAQRDSTDPRPEGHPCAQEPRRCAADLRSDADDAGPEFSAAVRTGLHLPVCVHGPRERPDGHRGRTLPRDPLGSIALARGGTLRAAAAPPGQAGDMRLRPSHSRGAGSRSDAAGDSAKTLAPGTLL